MGPFVGDFLDWSLAKSGLYMFPYSLVILDPMRNYDFGLFKVGFGGNCSPQNPSERRFPKIFPNGILGVPPPVTPARTVRSFFSWTQPFLRKRYFSQHEFEKLELFGWGFPVPWTPKLLLDDLKIHPKKRGKTPWFLVGINTRLPSSTISFRAEGLPFIII